MSGGTDTETPHRTTVATGSAVRGSPLGILGITTAAGTLAWNGPGWFVPVAIALLGSSFVAPPVFAVTFGQVALVATGATPTTVAVVESGLFLALLSTTATYPGTHVATGVFAVFAPLVGGVVWVALTVWAFDPLVVGAVVLAVAGVGSYFLHRYLLLGVGVLSPRMDDTE